jgi:hypothetical protein
MSKAAPPSKGKSKGKKNKKEKKDKKDKKDKDAPPAEWTEEELAALQEALVEVPSKKFKKKKDRFVAVSSWLMEVHDIDRPHGECYAKNKELQDGGASKGGAGEEGGD